MVQHGAAQRPAERPIRRVDQEQQLGKAPCPCIPPETLPILDHTPAALDHMLLEEPYAV